MLNIGWIGFSKRDRDMVKSVLRQLDAGALDELGIGTIRDAFSNIFFPGTSTGQTRAKYMFIIPYICLELQREEPQRGNRLSPAGFIESLENVEVEVIKTLKDGDEWGVIGKRSEETLQRKPSSIYWNALRTYGFFTQPLTRSAYADAFCRKRDSAVRQKSNGRRNTRDEDDATDDPDAGMFGITFWGGMPEVKRDWRKNVTMKLTDEEAKFMKNKILSISRPEVKGSLLALILEKNYRDFCEYENFAEISGMLDILPPEMRDDFCLARDFSDFVFGAQVRYNVIFSEGQNKDANDKWIEYKEKRPYVDLAKLQTRLKKIRPDVMSFLKQFQECIQNKQDPEELIIKREKYLKVSRAKLRNNEFYRYDGNNVNMEPINYRFYIAQRIINDIFEGMGANA
jgi:hypothetical protein